MKRGLFWILCLGLLLSLASCQATAVGERPEEILLLSDGKALEQRAEIRALWSVLQQYAEETAVAVRLIEAKEKDQLSRLEALEETLSSTVTTVVCQGEAYAPVVYVAQKRYPEVNFLLFDAEPHGDWDGIYESCSNSHSILFRENEGGFLAGYAAVQEGARRLGVCAGVPGASSLRYVYGFMQGADVAAAGLDLQVSLRYHIAEADEDRDALSQRLKAWYADGTQTIFLCDQGNQALATAGILAAEDGNGLLIAADADRRADSDRIAAAVVKDYGGQLRRALEALAENGGLFPADRAGRSLLLGMKEGALSLSWDASRGQFSSQLYEDLLTDIKQGAIVVTEQAQRDLLPPTPHCTIAED